MAYSMDLRERVIASVEAAQTVYRQLKRLGLSLKRSR